MHGGSQRFHHRAGCKIAAIMEFHAVAQGKTPGEFIQLLPLRGQCGLRVTVSIKHDQGFTGSPTRQLKGVIAEWR
ncbi:hypothetical protein OS11_23430 [Dickeya oryzae]